MMGEDWKEAEETRETKDIEETEEAWEEETPLRLTTRTKGEGRREGRK
jgi:hypothetical protein